MAQAPKFSSRRPRSEADLARMQALDEVISLLNSYANEAGKRGWTGPERVYRLAIVKLKKELLGEVDL